MKEGVVLQGQDLAQVQALALQGFKSYRSATLRLAGGLNLLIGPNASGKSNALEALRLLHEMADGRYLDEIYRTLSREGLLRGKRRELVWEGGENFRLRLAVRAQGKEYRWEVTIKVQPELHVVAESLTLEGESLPTYWVGELPETAAPHALRVAYNNFARGGKKPFLWVDDRRAVFAQLNTPAVFTTPKAQREIPSRLDILRRALSRMYFLEPRPKRMRGYVSLESGGTLEPDGYNLSAVLYHLAQQPEMKEEVLDFIRALPEGEIVGLDFIRTARHDVMVQVTERFGRREYTWDATVLSDGTLRVLATAALLLSVPQGSTVVIEEVDNGVHPSRASTLIQKMRNVIERRSLQVLLTTHNPALLDALAPELWAHVVYCYRDPEAGDSRFISLPDLPDYPGLTLEGSLGSLLARRVLERATREALTPQERQKRNLVWLEQWLEEGERHG